jgi:hypothetical protein
MVADRVAKADKQQAQPSTDDSIGTKWNVIVKEAVGK